MQNGMLNNPIDVHCIKLPGNVKSVSQLYFNYDIIPLKDNKE